MSNSDKKKNWLDVSLDVDNRAKIYALLKDKKVDSGEQPRAKGIHGIIPHDCLLKRFDYNNLSFAKWDWVFGPLIEFIFKSDLAQWICLGHFEGDSALWLYYFSEQLSPLHKNKEIQLERMPAFRKAYKCFAYNSWSKITRPPIILLSTLMQKIMAANIGNEKYPQGASLFLSFTPESLIEKNIPYLWTINFIDEAQKVKEQENIGKIDREKILNELCPDEYIKKRLNNFYSGSLDEDEICKRNIFFYSKNDFNSIRSKINKNAQKYEQQLYNIFSDDVISLSANNFSPELWEYYSNIRKFDTKNDIDARLSRYVVWLHDSVDTLTGVLCIPAWFPTGIENSESASLIVCFKNPVSNNILKSIISAFRLGSCSVAIRSERKESLKLGEKTGQSDLSYTHGHEMKALNSFLTTDFWLKNLDFFFDVSTELINEDTNESKKIGKILWYKSHEKYRELIKGFGLFPFKDMVKNIGQMNNFWGNIISKIDIPFKYKEPKDLTAFIKECWKYSIKNFTISMFCPENISELKKLIFLYELKNSLEMNFGDNIKINGELIHLKWKSNAEPTQVVHSFEKPSSLNLLAKIFIAIFNNCLMHGDWLAPVEINIKRLSRKDFFLVSIENKINTKPENEIEDTLLEKLCSSFTLSTDFYNQFELKRLVIDIFIRGKLRLKSFSIISNKGKERNDIKTPFVIRYCLENLNEIDFKETDYEIKNKFSKADAPNEHIYHQEKIQIKFPEEDTQ